MTTYEGTYDARDLRVVLVASRFNETIVRRLVAGARDCLLRHGVPDEAIAEVWVPGAFEIPAATRRVLETRRFDAVVTLGAVIRGETAHFDYVAGHALDGVGRISVEADIPVTCGILTTEDVAQADDRAGGKAGNKGAEAALAAIEMANLYGQLPKPGGDL